MRDMATLSSHHLLMMIQERTDLSKHSSPTQVEVAMDRKEFFRSFREDPVFSLIMNHLPFYIEMGARQRTTLIKSLKSFDKLEEYWWEEFIESIDNGETVVSESTEIRYFCVGEIAYNDLSSDDIFDPNLIIKPTENWSSDVLALDFVLNGGYVHGYYALNRAEDLVNLIPSTETMGEPPIWDSCLPDLPRIRIEYLVKVTMVRDAAGGIQSIGVEVIKVPYKD